MSEENHRGADWKFMLGFFIGGLLGALVIFFIGTKEGKRAGKLLERKGKEVADDVMDRLDELEEKGKDLIEKGEELKSQVLDTLDEKKEQLTEEAVKRVDTALSHIEAIQERGRETTANLRRQFKNLPKKA